MRRAVEGLTPRVAAMAASLTGPQVFSTTRARSWGRVRVSSVEASARADTATSSLDAAMTASVTSSASWSSSA
jgi:hypothetical protein